MTVPYVVFDDDANPPLDGLSESVAAAQAAVERFAAPAVRAALTVPEGDAAGGGERRAYLNWLAMADATLTFPLAVCNRYRFVQPGRSDEASADYEAFFLGRMRRLEATLSDGRAFLVGGRFTLADLCVGYSLHLAHQLGIGEKCVRKSGASASTAAERLTIAALLIAFIARALRAYRPFVLTHAPVCIITLCHEFEGCPHAVRRGTRRCCSALRYERRCKRRRRPRRCHTRRGQAEAVRSRSSDVRRHLYRVLCKCGSIHNGAYISISQSAPVAVGARARALANVRLFKAVNRHSHCEHGSEITRYWCWRR